MPLGVKVSRIRDDLVREVMCNRMAEQKQARRTERSAKLMVGSQLNEYNGPLLKTAGATNEIKISLNRLRGASSSFPHHKSKWKQQLNSSEQGDWEG